MRMLMIVALLFTVTARADNPVDYLAATVLKWEDTETAAKMSDRTLATHVLGTLSYTYFHQSEKKWEYVGAVAGAYATNLLVNQIVKRSVGRVRPNGHDDQSFYSGHTSTAFVGAGAVCLQDKKAPCAIALGLAGMVGYLRIAANWHWTSDVAVGAGVGYAMGRFVPTIFVVF